jgi:hypothetical protein
MEPQLTFQAFKSKVLSNHPPEGLKLLPPQEVVFMAKKINPAPFAIVIGIAIILQLALIVIDCQQTPGSVARNFTEAYYALNPDMQDYLCANLVEKDVVDRYLYQRKQQASSRGYSTGYMRQAFMELHVNAVEQNDTAMTFHVHGTARTCINRPFMIIGKLFGLGRDYPVDEHIDVVKENGRWRVCGNPFGIDPQG